MKKLTDKELEREIRRVEQQIDQSKSKYLAQDLTRYLRRLQKERYRRIKEQR